MTPRCPLNIESQSHFPAERWHDGSDEGRAVLMTQPGEGSQLPPSLTPSIVTATACLSPGKQPSPPPHPHPPSLIILAWSKGR